ncbi:MAG TPA: hypothetical protein VMG60_07950 [Burkholderiaceae bacterium]|nr:hypothetical protein [Burkholderiaceae bacterium]
MLKAICALSLLPLVSACGTTPQFQTRFYGGSSPTYGGTYIAPAGFAGPSLLDPHFYMDDEDAPRWYLMSVPPNR